MTGTSDRTGGADPDHTLLLCNIIHVVRFSYRAMVICNCRSCIGICCCAGGRSGHMEGVYCLTYGTVNTKSLSLSLTLGGDCSV